MLSFPTVVYANTGIDECLKVEIAPSKNREFPCVDFIDSPGLVDGEVLF